MIITHHGQQCFKFQQGQTVVGVNLFEAHRATEGSKKSSRSMPATPRFKPDIILASMIHPDFAPNGAVELEIQNEKDPFVIFGPGQYEIKEIVIKGFLTDADYQGQKFNTFYILEWEGLRVAIVGALKDSDLPSEVKEEVVDCDIWITPIGGSGLLEAEEAYKLAVKMEPAIIIPCHFDNGNGSALDHFLKSGGLEKAEAQDKLTLKKKDVVGQTGEIVVLNSQ